MSDLTIARLSSIDNVLEVCCDVSCDLFGSPFGLGLSVVAGDGVGFGAHLSRATTPTIHNMLTTTANNLLLCNLGRVAAPKTMRPTPESHMKNKRIREAAICTTHAN